MDICQFIDPSDYGFISAPKDKISAQQLKEDYGCETFQIPVHAPPSMERVDFDVARAKFAEFCKLNLDEPLSLIAANESCLFVVPSACSLPTLLIIQGIC